MDPGAPVVSIGNLTVGGSGKTPVAREVLARLRAMACEAHGLSRGRWMNVRSLLGKALALMRPMLPGRSVHPLLPEWAALAAETASRLKRLELFGFSVPLIALPDVDEGGDGRVHRAEGVGDPGADVRRGDRLRRLVAGMPVVLVPRVQDIPQVGDNVRANQGTPV